MKDIDLHSVNYLDDINFFLYKYLCNVTVS